MKFSIVIPTYRHLNDLLIPCIESIIKYTELEDAEVIIVANGCENDGTREYVQSLGPSFKLVWIDEQNGYTKSTNEGIKVAKGDYIILLNNDTILLEQNKNDWINLLLQPFSDPEIGLTGPFESFSPEAQANFLIFFCVAIRKQVFEKIGLLDEAYSPGFGEDVAFCIDAAKAGYKSVQVPPGGKLEGKILINNFPIYHAGEKTLKDLPKGKELLTRNRIRLAKKYSKSIKLNLGCGDKKWDGFIGVDLYNPNADIFLDVINLQPFDNNSVDEICGYHIFEHLSPYEVGDILREWFRVLKPGGMLALEMPDILEICRNFEKEDKNGRYRLLNCIYGTTQIEHGHLFGWYDEILRDHLIGAGFNQIERKPLKMPEHWGHNMRYEAIKPKKKRVYDCFSFFNEIELAKLRFEELDEVVDHFVVVEANKTHSGKWKQLYFKENINQFTRWAEKIIHIIVDKFPEGDQWVREAHQRDAIKEGLSKSLNPADDDDIVIIGDADEIPRASAIASIGELNEIKTLQTTLSYYYLNTKQSQTWDHLKVMPYKLVKNDSPTFIRYRTVPVIPDAGWHFSFLGGAEKISQKIDAYGHQEYNIPEINNLDHIKKAVETGKDVFNREFLFEPEPINNSYPLHVRQNKNYYEKIGFIKPTKMTFHVCSLPNYPISTEYVTCAFNQKIFKFCKMMKSLGHKVYLYAPEDSNSTICDELIQTISRKDQCELIEEPNCKTLSKMEYDSNQPYWHIHNGNTINGIKKRYRDGDHVIFVGGHAQKSILEAFPDAIEPFVGYEGPISKHLVLESHTHQAFIAGYYRKHDLSTYHVIPNYYDVNDFIFEQKKDNYLLFVGRLSPVKGLDIAIDIALRTKTKLKIAGQPADFTLPNHPLLEYIGVLDIYEKAKVMSKAKAVLCPSRYAEPFCGVCAEAQLCGTPVIAPDYGAFVETIEDGKTGFRCSTMEQYCEVVHKSEQLDKKYIRDRAVSLWDMNIVKYQYENYFKNL